MVSQCYLNSLGWLKAFLTERKKSISPRHPMVRCEKTFDDSSTIFHLHITLFPLNCVAKLFFRNSSVFIVNCGVMLQSCRIHFMSKRDYERKAYKLLL